jgi:hypothetical protein
MKLFSLLVLTTTVFLAACERESPTNGIVTPSKPAAPQPPPPDLDSPNPNAAHYGPHGVAATPPPTPGARSVVAPPLNPAEPTDVAGHACHCGASCKCGHCAGAIPGCHCKTERNDSK